jgi:hypothetical protein
MGTSWVRPAPRTTWNFNRLYCELGGRPTLRRILVTQFFQTDLVLGRRETAPLMRQALPETLLRSNIEVLCLHFQHKGNYQSTSIYAYTSWLPSDGENRVETY